MRYPFASTVQTEEALRSVLGWPSARAVEKEKTQLDKHFRHFLSRSPFALISTSNRSGKCDVSPRGDGPGFVEVLDDRTILIPDRPGNRRGDTLSNILENPQIGLLFIIPRIEESLRVNGKAANVNDQSVLESLAVQGKLPQLAIAVETQEVYFQCAKAFRRSGLWEYEKWEDQSDFPSLGQILLDQVNPPNANLESIDCELEESYKINMY
ncbi:pyridoxamine 5'-phosphate oxidase family protein [soil metagenome]